MVQWEIKIKPNKTPHWTVDHLHSRLIYSLKLKELADSAESAYYDCPCYWKKGDTSFSTKTSFIKKTGFESAKHCKHFLIFMPVYGKLFKYRLIIMRSSISAITWDDIQQLSINLPEFTQLMNWQNNSCKFV